MRYKRVLIPGATYFFTVNLLNRQSKLLVEQIHHLRASFHKVQSTHPFAIDAIVILPEHFHMIMTLPEEDRNYPLRLRLIKGYFSKYVATTELISTSRKKKGERGIWQRRYWEHSIQDEKDYEHHLDYIHNNPVKHHYVKKPWEWPYSSIHRSIKKGILPLDWTCGPELK